MALPFLTGYTRERCKEPEIRIERLICKETEKTNLSGTQIETQIFAGTQIDIFEMSFRVIRGRCSLLSGRGQSTDWDRQVL